MVVFLCLCLYNIHKIKSRGAIAIMTTLPGSLYALFRLLRALQLPDKVAHKIGAAGGEQPGQ